MQRLSHIIHVGFIYVLLRVVISANGNAQPLPRACCSTLTKEWVVASAGHGSVSAWWFHEPALAIASLSVLARDAGGQASEQCSRASGVHCCLLTRGRPRIVDASKCVPALVQPPFLGPSDNFLNNLAVRRTV
eukprot:4405116-Amphidinium_carterae.1